MSASRRLAHLALALVLSVFAIAPHRHEGFTEDLFRGAVTVVTTCDSSPVRHFDAARQIHSQPCVACVRNHTAGAIETFSVGSVLPQATERHAVVAVRPAVSSRIDTPLRGPPAA